VKLRWGYSIIDLSDSLAVWLINGEEDGDLSVDTPFCGLKGLSSIGQSRLNMISEDVVLNGSACVATSLSDCLCARLGLRIEDFCPRAHERHRGFRSMSMLLYDLGFRVSM
jgi:hypothetical protein